MLILALLVGFFPVSTYATGNTWADIAPQKNLDLTLPTCFHDFPIASDANFLCAKALDGDTFTFAYSSNWSMDDLFNMYSEYMKNSRKFEANKGDGRGVLYGVHGIKGGYRVLITIGLSIDNQVAVGIEPYQD
jgi:hypothetical protein